MSIVCTLGNKSTAYQDLATNTYEVCLPGWWDGRWSDSEHPAASDLR